MIYGGYFDVSKKEKRIKELEEESNRPDFWNDTENAQKITLELNGLKEKINDAVSLKKDIEDNLEMISLLESEEDDSLLESISAGLSNIEKKISSLELEVLLSGEYDNCNAILDVHSGAGGTEACDWTSMLLRMYERWCDSKGYKYELLDVLDGDEAGIKRATLLIKGLNAYGYLKCEKGIHRLVRLSPFDANNKRHTSFASVEVVPEIEETGDIEIKDEDLKIDVYRSSGAGGQGVNTTDSAVRITHIPSGIVVTCQNERSQIKNKEKALNVLKGKLKLIEIEENEKKMASIKGESMNIDFGSQIRSYVMHPYSMVKDHRTNVETSNVSKVLDGDLDMFIEAYLRR